MEGLEGLDKRTKKMRSRVRKHKSLKITPDKNEDHNHSNVVEAERIQQSTKSLSKLDISIPNSKLNRSPLPYLEPTTINLLEQYNVIFSANIRINQRFPLEAYLPNNAGGADYVIEGFDDRNRSLDGDLVYAMLKISGGSTRNKAAVVVGIKELVHNRICVGTIRKKKKSTLYPTDVRLPKVHLKNSFLPLEFQKNDKTCEDYLFSTKIVDWLDNCRAIGGPVTVLGKSGTMNAERDAIILKHALDVTPHPESFNRNFPSAEAAINDDVLKDRLDLRKNCIFTIDPATAKDLDDAVSCDVNESGGYTIGVHIADVSHFLAEGTDLDEAVSKRATTVYLVDEVYHMLPKKLCLLCSLTPGEDKLAFSVIWHFSEEGNILGSSIRKTVINSCAQLSYEQVQAMLESKDPGVLKIENGFSKDDIDKRIHILNKFAKQLRSARVEAGALRIDQLKINFMLDEKGRPSDFAVHQQLDSHKLIEEFMLLANTTVANKIEEKVPTLAMLRHHFPPKEEYLCRLQTEFESYGVVLDVSSSKALQTSLNRYSWDRPNERSQVMVINNALTKPMQRANYFCSSFSKEKQHYALSIPLYTHFTSPIRRYADIIVHRLLASALDYRVIPNYTPEYVQSIAETCNKKKYSAKLAGDASTDLFFALYVGERGSLLVEAVVCNVGQQSFDALLLLTGSHVKVLYNTVDGKVTMLKNEKVHEVFIEWADGPKQRITMFSIVNLEITRGNGILLDARLIPIFEESK